MAKSYAMPFYSVANNSLVRIGLQWECKVVNYSSVCNDLQSRKPFYSVGIILRHFIDWNAFHANQCFCAVCMALVCQDILLSQKLLQPMLENS